MSINARWHRRHRMPKHATLEERIAWHREHSQHCDCHPVPLKLLALLWARPRVRLSVPGETPLHTPPARHH